jgi:RNA polymerase sigma-70 factor (sigma-E family)
VFSRRQPGIRPDPAFDEFVTARSAVLLRTAHLLVGDRGHAEDLLQTALLRTALRWRKALDHPEAYTRQIIVNLARDHWRRSRRRPAEQPESDFTPDPAQRDHAAGVVDKQALLAALGALPERQREVVVLRYFADLSITEAAAAMRTSEGTVKSQTSRALDHLRRILGADTTLEANDVR